MPILRLIFLILKTVKNIFNYIEYEEVLKLFLKYYYR